MMWPSTMWVVLLCLSLVAGCQSFLVVSTTLPRLGSAVTKKSAAEASTSRTHRRAPIRKGSDSDRASSPRPSSESIEEARGRLMASSEYDAMVSRVEARNPFTVGKGNSEESDDDENVVWRATKATVRFVADLLIVLLPVVLCVNSGILPAVALAPLETAVAAIRGSPVEPLLETLPWPSGEALKWATEIAVALVLSPLADRLVVTPATVLFARAKLKALATPRKQK